MSNLENLINKLCPNGVHFKPLWSITIWDKKFNSVDRGKQDKSIDYHYFLAAELKPLITDSGDVKILTTNISNLWTTSELAADYVSSGEIVCIPWGGNPVVQYYNGKFITSDNRIAIAKNKNEINMRFLYHFLSSKIDLISSFYRGAGIKHPDMAKVLDLDIPIPPMEVQSEIVRILDNFAELTAELTAELSLRKSQYNFYSNKLFDDINCKTVKISELLVSLKTGLNPRKNFKLNIDGADCPYITGKDIFNNRINVTERTDLITADAVLLINRRAKLEDDILLFASTGCGTVGRMAVVEHYDGTWNLSETLYCMKTKNNVLTKYLMYFLYSARAVSQFEGKITKGSVPHLKIGDLLNVEVPVPSIEEQKRIVSIIEKFDLYVNGIKEGLPAEIDGRQKQYEHYREKLLNFNCLNN